MESRKPEAAAAGCFLLWFAFWAVVSVAVVGVAFWAVVKLVNHFTG